jgi:hypothetical protein
LWTKKLFKAVFITGAIIILIVFLLIPGSGFLLLGLAAAGVSIKNKTFQNKLPGILKKPKKTGKRYPLPDFYPRLIRFDSRLATLEANQMKR